MARPMDNKPFPCDEALFSNLRISVLDCAPGPSTLPDCTGGVPWKNTLRIPDALSASGIRVRVLRCAIVVAPVTQSGGAAIELVQRTCQGADPHVRWRKPGCQPAVDLLQVLQQISVLGKAAQGRLPRMHMGGHKAWQHNTTCEIDDLGIPGL